MRGIEQFLQVDAATLGALKYAGTWNASTNTPTLASGVGVQGQYYVVSVAGNTNLDGETAWQVGDWAVFNGTVWQKVDGGSTGLLSTLTVTGNAFLATTSGDVGIGTSSPSVKLDVNGIGKFSTRVISPAFYGSTTGITEYMDSLGTTGIYVTGAGASPSNSIRFYSAGTLNATLDSAGNLGLGVTPSAWNANFRAYQAGSAGYAAFVGDQSNGHAEVLNNCYASGASTYTYSQSLGATRYSQQLGIHAWYTAGAGTAGNTISFTQAMTLDASGNLGVGTSTPLQQLHLSSASATGMQITYQGVGASRIGIAAGNLLTFGLDTSNGTTTRMAIDSSGNVGVGTSSPSSFGIIVAKKDQTADTAISVSNAGAANAATSMSFTLNEGGTPQGWLRRYRDGTGNTEVGFSDALLFTGSVTGTKAERARIDSSGNLLVGGTSPVLSAANRGNITITGSASSIVSVGTSASAYTYLYHDASGAEVWNNQNTYLRFGTSNTERARIDASGNLGVGTSSPTYKADIQVASGADRNILLAGVSGASNGFHVKWINSTSKTHVIIADIPTSSSGLAAGTLWNDGGTIKIA